MGSEASAILNGSFPVTSLNSVRLAAYRSRRRPENRFRSYISGGRYPIVPLNYFSLFSKPDRPKSANLIEYLSVISIFAGVTSPWYISKECMKERASRISKKMNRAILSSWMCKLDMSPRVANGVR